jgi:hypothetical protein
MARKTDEDNTNTAATDTNANQTAPATTAAPTAPVPPPGGDERYKTVTAPDGKVWKRADYIRFLYHAPNYWGRGQIAKHLSELTGKKVLYQTIFSVVGKNEPGGPSANPNRAQVTQPAAPAEATS